MRKRLYELVVEAGRGAWGASRLKPHPVVAAPEPSIGLLLSLALLGVVFRGRR